VPIVDCHVHLYPPEVNGDPAAWAAAHNEPRFAALCTRRRRNGRPVQFFPSLEGLLSDMDAAGIDFAVLLGWYWENQASCVLQNRFYAGCVRSHPDRLAAFAALNASGPPHQVLEEVRRAREDGLAGLGEIFPAAQGFGAGGPGFAEVLSLAGDLRMPVNLHATDPGGRPYPGMLPTPHAEFLGMARDHPSTLFILAHWGGMLPILAPGALALPNLHYDTAASPLMYDPGVWTRFIGAVGATRVLFGSDYPLNLYPREDSGHSWPRLLAEARGAGIGDVALQQLLGENTLRVIGGPRRV
jgi:predicted TIM-barrel fold metal-dependent hydrolase